MPKMEFKFDHEHVSSLDERVTAIFSVDGTIVAIAKKDALQFASDDSLLMDGKEILDACYSFTSKWIEFDDIELSYQIQIANKGSLDLVTLKNGGFIRISDKCITSHLVTENGEMTSESIGNWDMSRSNRIVLQKMHDKISFLIGNEVVHVDIEENCREGLEIIGLFGSMVNAECKIYSVSISEMKE